MAIKKQYIEGENLCKVTFKIPAEDAKAYKTVHLLGDFNNWDPIASQLKRQKRDDSFAITLTLETGKEYQFRYLFDNQFWGNDSEADRHVPTIFGDSENSVLET